MKPALPEKPDLAAMIASLDTACTFEPTLRGPAQGIHLPQRLFKRRPRARKAFDYSQVANAVRLLKTLPQEGETWHLLMSGDFNTYDLIAAVIELAGVPCQELCIATLATNARAVEGFKRMLDAGKLARLEIVLSTYFEQADRDACAEVLHDLRAIGAEAHVARSHAKVCAFDFGAFAIVAESSANLRSCRGVEQVIVTNDRELFRFYAEAIKLLPTHAKQ